MAPLRLSATVVAEGVGAGRLHRRIMIIMQLLVPRAERLALLLRLLLLLLLLLPRRRRHLRWYG